jgi:hypothetical protein
LNPAGFGKHRRIHRRVVGERSIAAATTASATASTSSVAFGPQIRLGSLACHPHFTVRHYFAQWPRSAAAKGELTRERVQAAAVVEPLPAECGPIRPAQRRFDHDRRLADRGCPALDDALDREARGAS